MMKRRWLGVGLVIGIGAMVGVPVLAGSSGTGAPITACVNGLSGATRIVDSASECVSAEEVVQWNAQGPPRTQATDMLRHAGRFDACPDGEWHVHATCFGQDLDHPQVKRFTVPLDGRDFVGHDVTFTVSIQASWVAEMCVRLRDVTLDAAVPETEFCVENHQLPAPGAVYERPFFTSDPIDLPHDLHRYAVEFRARTLDPEAGIEPAGYVWFAEVLAVPVRS